MMSRRIAVVLAACSTAVGLWIAAPSRNLVGNPCSETLIDSCVLVEPEAVARLYEGGGGSTTANWYSATIDPAGWPGERQVYFVERSGPKVLLCDADGLHLGQPPNRELLTGAALRTAYAGSIYSPNLDDAELASRARNKTWKQGMGLVLAAMSAGFLVRAIRSS